MNEKYHQKTYIKVIDDPNLRKIPIQLPDTRKISMWFIGRRGTPHSNNLSYYLHSFRDLPKKLPSLNKIDINNSNISNFEDLHSEMPNLKEIGFTDCHIRNFRGFPTAIFSAHDSIINSFEGLELSVPYNNEEGQIYLANCTIRSFSGVSRSTLQAILIAILSMDYEYYSKEDMERLKNMGQLAEFGYKIARINNFKVRNKLDLTPTGRKLLFESINFQIERQYNPKFNREWPLPSNDPDNPQYLHWELDESEREYYIYQDDPDTSYIDHRDEFYKNYMIHADEWRMLNEEGSKLFLDAQNGIYPKHSPSSQPHDETWDWNTYHEHYPSYDPNRNGWIYAFDLSEKLFIPEKLNRLHEFYQKTTLQLAQEYISDPKNLLPDQIERLTHETDPYLRKMLENNLPVTDPLIKQLSAKFSFKSPKDLKILK